MYIGLIGGIGPGATDSDDVERVHRAYADMAIAGRVTEQQREVFFSVAQKPRRERGAEALMLGGTDLFLAFDGRKSGFETIDCASVHIEAIYRASTATAPSARATG